MDVRWIDLPWLTEPTPDFRQQVRTLATGDAEARLTAQRLASCRLQGSRLYGLGDAVARLALSEATAVRLGVLSNATADLLLPALSASALRHGVWLQTVGTAFDQVAPEALNAESAINQGHCHFVLLAVDHRGLPLVSAPGDEPAARAAVDAALQYVDSLVNALRGHSGCTVIVQTIPQVAQSLFGSLERQVPGTLQWMIDRYNTGLRSRLSESPDLLLDIAALAEIVGLAQWHDPTQWALGKFAFSHAIVPLYADYAARLIAAARGKSRKCLVLDLDNTLWGGVIGDDGLAGIVLGNGSPGGEAFLEIQKMALALRNRGIVLAVSSRNDDSVARSPFRSHPDMVLKEEHIAVFQANWQDKASNLEAIAKTLAIGVDALVLLDDNPAERAQVRAALPTVAVPELPPDAAFYTETLLAAGYFETTAFTAEDRLRAGQYQANAARSATPGAPTDLESHLRSLGMKAICGPFAPMNRSRVTQLINKSNQFNLTTRRYTEAEVAALERSIAGMTLQLRLIDRFGDNGLIAVVICTEADSDWLIDTWLMSCRVLNRKVEHATLNYVVDRARKAGVRALIGQYVRSDRNGMVEDHYANLGFTPLNADDAGSRWRLEVASHVAPEIPIEIEV